MAKKIAYDDSNLQQLFAEMDVKRRVQSLKGAFRKTANQVRKTAINNLRGENIRNAGKIGEGIYTKVFKRKAGFSVSIAPRKIGKNGKGEKGMYETRTGTHKPILLWAELGTNARKTKSQTRIFKRSRKGHPTGRMKRYGFMRKTETEVRDKVTTDFRNEVTSNIIRVSKKYGCK